MDFAAASWLQLDYDENYAIDLIGGSAISFDPEVDARGNLVELAHPTPAQARSYTYDALSRLTAVEDGTAATLEAFTYDATGNRLSKQANALSQSYGYAPSNHRLSNVAGVARAYDAMGSLTDRGDGWTFEYNDAQRLQAGKHNGALHSTATYNGRGERVVRSTGATSRHFLYADSGSVLAEYEGTISKEYLWLDERLVGVAVHTGPYASDVLSVHTDHLGTPRALEGSGVVRWKWPLEGSAFGEDVALDDYDADGISLEFNLRYPGQYFDAGSGLHYNYFRDYEPGTGRYVESDPSRVVRRNFDLPLCECLAQDAHRQAGPPFRFLPHCLQTGVGVQSLNRSSRSCLPKAGTRVPTTSGSWRSRMCRELR